MKVIKIGGGCLKGRKEIGQIVDLIAARGQGHVFVVSALNGVTDFLIESMRLALEGEDSIPKVISRLQAKHMNVARHLISHRKRLKAFSQDLNKSLTKLERLYYGLNFTKEMTPRIQDVICSFGERFSAQLLGAIMRDCGLRAGYRMPHKIGLVTDGKYGDATVNFVKTQRNFKKYLVPILNEKNVTFIPGFFGASEDGDITTFGRGGSDYSAAVVAAGLAAEILEIWKDVDGFMSADPKMVPEAQLIPILSYEEAAELAYFGAKILHPRTVEPVRNKKIKIAIKNTVNPDATGSIIKARSPRPKSVIKSVSYDTDIGIIKVHASGVGARLGFLALVASSLTECGINIKSVVTSQTCISLLLAQKDLEAGHAALSAIKPRPFRRLEILNDVALISIVGDGLIHKKGIAARCFTAVSNCNVNVEMISFGPSRAALYFLTKVKDLHSAVNAIHSTFFATPRCS